MDETQQLLLWRWSTVVQLTSLAMVAAFFALLAHANPRPELRWWARAWTANLLALAATTIYWLVQSDAAFPLVAALYVAGKTVFTALLAQGAWSMIRPGNRLFTSRSLAIAVAVYAVIAAIFLRDITTVGIGQHSLMGVLMVGLAVPCGAAAPTASRGWSAESPFVACWPSPQRGRTSFNGHGRGVAPSPRSSSRPAHFSQRARRSTWAPNG
jgi:hypothetical protein